MKKKWENENNEETQRVFILGENPGFDINSIKVGDTILKNCFCGRNNINFNG